MREKKYTWHKIAETIEELRFKKNSILQMAVGNKNICIIKTEKGISACAAKCPHAGGAMCEGALDKNENIICPVHRYTFNLNTGRDITGEGYYLKIYPVEIKDSGIFLGIEEAGFFRSLQ